MQTTRITAVLVALVTIAAAGNAFAAPPCAMGMIDTDSVGNGNVSSNQGKGYGNQFTDTKRGDYNSTDSMAKGVCNTIISYQQGDDNWSRMTQIGDFGGIASDLRDGADADLFQKGDHSVTYAESNGGSISSTNVGNGSKVIAILN